MTKPMTRIDLWELGQQAKEADRLNRTPDAFCEIEPQQYEAIRGPAKEEAEDDNAWPPAFMVLLCIATPFACALMYELVTSWVPALVQAIGWSG